MENSESSYANHPCFGMTSRSTVGRLHLPVAPRANSKVRFSPLVKPRPAMMPDEAVAWLDHVVSTGNPVGIVGITGPGDPCAVPEKTLRTLTLVREKYPDMDLCLTTVGMGLADYVTKLAELKISHVTLLVDAVSAEVAEKIYAWVRPSTRTVPLKEAVEFLIKEQAQAVAALKEVGITVKINTTVYPGYNAGHVEEIARSMARFGADIMAIVPYRPTEEDLDAAEAPGTELMATVRDRAAKHINLMPAWEECGEPLVGLKRPDLEDHPVSVMPKPTKERPNVAVVSSTGIEVDLHLGHAVKALVYGPRADGLACLLESRDLPEPGTGSARWKKLSSVLSDCFVLLTASAGERPKEILSRSGLTVLITDNEIEGTVDVLYGGGKKGKKS